MIDAVDRELRERFAPLADPTDDSSWGELRTPPRARVVAIAAALALVVVVAASAVGAPAKIVRLFDRAPTAPRDVTRSFSDFDQIVGTDLAAPPRRVLDTGSAAVWVAPTTTGGYCSLVKVRHRNGTWEGAGGECGPHFDGLSVDVTLPRGTALVYGLVGRSHAASLRLDFEDGATASIPFVWVSAPVATGFFAYSVPERRLQPGHRPTHLTVLSADGHELASAEVHGILAR